MGVAKRLGLELYHVESILADSVCYHESACLSLTFISFSNKCTYILVCMHIHKKVRQDPEGKIFLKIE